MDRVLIIAEAGVNHNGNLKIALELVEAAAKSGADAIKFQTFKALKLVTKIAEKTNYQKQTTNAKESQLEMLSKLELTYEDHIKLIKHAQDFQIKFLSTPFDQDSIELLNKLNLDTFKIPSGEITNLPYLQNIGRLGKKVYLSTGMANINEIERAVCVLTNSGTKKKDITILHATTEYPAPFNEVNLMAIQTIRDRLEINVGYSDHTLGVEVPIAAVAIGARIIEKHFTLDKNMEGPDHRASLTPEEFSKMVSSIRNIEKALGNGIKIPTPSELKNLPLVRKSIHYNANLKKGHFINENDLIMKRPGIGVSPFEVPNILEKQLKHDVIEDTLFKWNDIQ